MPSKQQKAGNSIANTNDALVKSQEEEKQQMQIKIVKDKDPECRDCYLAIDGVQNGYTKEGEFAGTIRIFLYENPDGEVSRII
jgi:hypothetical protein